ncbi:MAG: dihydrodipicolinate synthase family protein [Bacteroidales bacterium]|nr:dihydrodipicolinate synthase family protein [Bacteroidales bacterium]
MSTNKRLSGLIAAPFTPMDKDGAVRIEVVEQYASLLIRSGVQGVFICGTTGEGASLTINERKSLAEKWVKEAKGRLKVIVHVGSTCQKDSIELSIHAQSTGADAIASIAPYFFKPANVDDLVRFFSPIANSAPELPFYYYNMPSMTGVDLPVDKFLLEGKKEIPSLAGVKFTHNNLMEMNQCIALNNGEFEVLHGYDEILICGLALGATAAVGSTYNYAAPVYNELVDAFMKGDLIRARELQQYSVEIVKVIIKHGGGVRGGKAIMKTIGINCGDCRSPITPFTQEEYNQIKEELREINFFKRIDIK